jgi:hypothetical protein
MVKVLICVLGVLQLCALTIATPLSTEDNPGSELINQQQFDLISLYEQYSAAAYCVQNYNSAFKQNKLACISGNCPKVQSATTNITLQLTA